MGLCDVPAAEHPADCQVCQTRHAFASIFAADAAQQAALEKQIAEDTCLMHRVFCCDICFDMTPAA